MTASYSISINPISIFWSNIFHWFSKILQLLMKKNFWDFIFPRFFSSIKAKLTESHFSLILQTLQTMIWQLFCIIALQIHFIILKSKVSEFSIREWCLSCLKTSILSTSPRTKARIRHKRRWRKITANWLLFGISKPENWHLWGEVEK